MFDKILQRFGYVHSSKSSLPGVLSSGSADPFTIFRSSRKIDAGRSLEAYTGWVYASIRAIGLDVGMMKHTLFEIGSERDKEIFESDLLDILGSPNTYMTGFELKYSTIAHLEAVGNAYWFLEGVNGPSDKPIAIHLMHPAKVKVVVNRNVFPSKVEGFVYRLASNVYTFNPDQVIHLKYPDPNDPYEGIGTVQSGAQWIDADNYAQEFNRGFFKNGARIGGFLESESAYTPEQLEYLKQSFAAAHQGAGNAYKIMALPKGTKYTDAGQSAKEMDFNSSSVTMRDRILAIFRVTRTALGITDDVNRANAEATDYVFAKRTVKPCMEIITMYLNHFLVPRYSEKQYLSYDDPVPEDRAQRIDEMNKSLGGAPAITVNEAREEYFGMEPIDGGDAVMVPFSFSPLGSTAPKGTATGERATGIVNSKRPTRSRFAMLAAKRQSISTDVGKRMAEIAAGIFKKAAEIKEKVLKEGAGIAQLTDDQYEALYKAFFVRVTPYEKKFRGMVADFNEKQRATVSKNLPNVLKAFLLGDTKAIKKSDLFDIDEEMAAFVDLAKPLYYDLASKEGREAAALLGFDNVDILSPEVQKALDKAAELLAQSYNSTTADLLKAKLEEGIKAGYTQEELTNVISAVYDYSDEVRAEQVARTETFRIANYATQEAWKQSGVVQSQKWYTAADERVCPHCGPLHGKVVGIDEDFFKKGETVVGSDGSPLVVEYSDVGAPPLHVSCRCYIRPEQISIA